MSEATVTLPEVKNGKLPISAIKTDHTSLRGVKRDGQEFVDLRENIRKVGLQTAVTVYPDVENGCYQLLDGLQRFTACSDIAQEDGKDGAVIDVKVDTPPTSRTDMLTKQIAANASRVQTKPVEFARACLVILEENPAMTQGDLAAQLGQNVAWVGKTLKLPRLSADAAALVDEGKITISNALALLDLPQAMHDTYLTEAQTETASDFGAKIKAAKETLKADAKAGGKAEFSPSAKVRSKNDIQAGIDDTNILKIIVGGVKDPMAAATAALAWTLSLDGPTVAAKRQAWEAEQSAREQKRAAKDAAAEDRKALADDLKSMSAEELAEVRAIAKAKLAKKAE